MTITRFSFPTTIHFGAGARALAGPHLRGHGLQRPLIVTDRGLAALPLIAELQAELEAVGLAVAVYGGVFGNPTGAQVMSGAAAYRAHAADCVVGVGGGAALDVAKVVGLLATHPGDVMEYVWDHPQARPITGALPHFIALPTTSVVMNTILGGSFSSRLISNLRETKGYTHQRKRDDAQNQQRLAHGAKC